MPLPKSQALPVTSYRGLFLDIRLEERPYGDNTPQAVVDRDKSDGLQTSMGAQRAVIYYLSVRNARTLTEAQLQDLLDIMRQGKPVPASLAESVFSRTFRPVTTASSSYNQFLLSAQRAVNALVAVAKVKIKTFAAEPDKKALWEQRLADADALAKEYASNGINALAGRWVHFRTVPRSATIDDREVNWNAFEIADIIFADEAAKILQSDAGDEGTEDNVLTDMPQELVRQIVDALDGEPLSNAVAVMLSKVPGVISNPDWLAKVSDGSIVAQLKQSGALSIDKANVIHRRV